MPILTPPVITNNGRAAAMSQRALGLSLELTHVMVGAASYVPDPAQVALSDPRHKGTLLGNSTVGDVVSGAMRVPGLTYTGAPFTIGEIGFYAGDPDAGGVLFAVLSNNDNIATPPTFGSLGGGNITDITASISMQLATLPAGSVTIVADPNVGSAAALLMAHINSANPHPAQDSTPIGSLIMFTGTTPPAGYVLPHGWLLLRNEYPLLWAFAQAQGVVVTEAEWAAGMWGRYSSGDGSTTFRVPDIRGESVRFADFGRGVDPGRLLGSFQDWGTGRPRTTTAQAINEAGVSGPLRTANLAIPDQATMNPTAVGFVRVSKTNNRANTAASADASGQGIEMDIINVVMGDAETRPRNVALNSILRASGAGSSAPALPTIAPSPTPVNPPAPTPAPAPAAGTPPTVLFSASPRNMTDTGYAGVYFTDMSTPGSSPIVSWLWELETNWPGGTTTLSQQHPFFQYQSLAASMGVRLTVTDAAGNTATRYEPNYIVIYDGGFGYNPGGA